jgi:hypothetical protein
MSDKYKPEWWASRIPFISAFAAGEKVLYCGMWVDEMRFDGNLSDYTIAPKTITVNGFEVPAPETVAPTKKTYFIPVVGDEEMVRVCFWDDHRFDLDRLKRGIVYINKDHAIARAKAMLGIDPAEDCK